MSKGDGGGQLKAALHKEGEDPKAKSETDQYAQELLDKSLEEFWKLAKLEIAAIKPDEEDAFKHYILPLARIKKIMKMDEEVKMISAEAPVVFAKACELLVSEMAIRAWHHTQKCHRRTVQKSDVGISISQSEMFDFLIDIVPRYESAAAGAADETLAVRNEDAVYSNLEEVRQYWQEQSKKLFSMYNLKASSNSKDAQVDNADVKKD